MVRQLLDGTNLVFFKYVSEVYAKYPNKNDRTKVIGYIFGIWIQNVDSWTKIAGICIINVFDHSWTIVTIKIDVSIKEGKP